MPDTPDRLVRRRFEEVWNQGREETIDTLLAPAATITRLISEMDGAGVSAAQR